MRHHVIKIHTRLHDILHISIIKIKTYFLQTICKTSEHDAYFAAAESKVHNIKKL